jgi:8-oxo-dGTP diphosphatase
MELTLASTVTCLDVDGNEYPITTDKLQWRPAAYGIVIKDGNILLSKQFGDKYDLPGGGLDLGEEPEAGVVREVKEETGMDVKAPVLVGLKNSYFHDAHAKQEYYHCILFYYSCQFVGGELSTEGFDEWEKQYAQMAEWIPLSKIDEIKLASSVDYRPFIKAAVEKK